MTRYNQRGYCSLCQKWYPLDELLKLHIKGVNAYVYYCRIHKKQVRLKSRMKPMSSVKLRGETS